MADEISTVEHEGFTITSNSETADDIRASLSRDEPDAKSLKADTETLDGSGKKHAGDGKFKGTVKPIKDAKAAQEEKAEEPENTAGKAAPAKQEAAEKPEKAKADAKPDADEIAAVKAEEEEKESQRRSQAADRVRQATQRAAEERRQREALAAENAQLKALLERGGQAAKPQEGRDSVQRDPRAPQPPDPNKYETMAEYLDARDTYNRQSWARELEERQQQYAAEQRARVEHEYITKVVAEAEKALSAPGALDGVDENLLELEPSFMAKARGVKPGPWNALADEIIKAGKDGPKILRYLSEHQEELQDFDHLTPLSFQRKMGEITGKLQAVTSAKPAPDSYTPEPFKPVRAVAGQAQHVERDEDEMSMDFDTLAARRLRQGKLLPLRR